MRIYEMNRFKIISLAAGMVLAVALILSCSSNNWEESVFTDVRDGKEYKTVVIGAQTWMAENLNYAVEGSLCYDNNPENCKQYGRLYDWATAMAACPSGWHLPNNYDWDELYRFVDPDGVGYYESEMAGKFLKAKSGWCYDANGIDKYGFSALPGGYSSSYGTFFHNLFCSSRWWSADERNGYDAHYRSISGGESASWSYDDKSNLFSVRCLQGDGPPPPDGDPFEYGSFTDERDGKEYKTTVIETQTWMAENLNYKPETGRYSCYNSLENYCVKFGLLYDWATAMAFDQNCNDGGCSDQIQPKHQGICPSGWHIPSNDEWDVLVEAVGGKESATKLKSKKYWDGTDDYGFSALPGGNASTSGSFGFNDLNRSGSWWSSTQNSNNDSYYNTFYYDCYGNSDGFYRKGGGYYAASIRCLKDIAP